MAADAGSVRTGQIVVVVDMALGALHGGVRAAQREAGGGVIEVRTRPRGGVMALLTGLRETRTHVVGIGRALEIFQVAADTRRVRAGQVVVPVHVAAAASQRGMSAHERESSRGMVKCRTSPGSGVVALLTGLREPGADVIGTRRSLEVFQVAADTRGVRAGEVVVVVDVTLRALYVRVRAGQREARRGMIKSCVCP